MIALTNLFNPRLWAAVIIATALAASHWKAYTAGKATVTAERVAEDLARSRAVLRYVETKTAQIANLEATYAKTKTRAAAAAADADGALAELRRALDAAPAGACTAPATGGNYVAGGLEREILGQCAGALAAMGAEADRLAGKVVALQGYVQAVRGE